MKSTADDKGKTCNEHAEDDGSALAGDHDTALSTDCPAEKYLDPLHCGVKGTSVSIGHNGTSGHWIDESHEICLVDSDENKA